MYKFSKNEIQKILDLLKIIGDEIIEIYDNFDAKNDVEYKSDNTPVTIADKKASDMIAEFLTKNYPNFTILCEEKNKENLTETEHFWVIDPIDGTKEFIRKNGEFTINIGLCFQNKSVAGFIYAPALHEMYYAIKDCGSFYLKSSQDFTLENFVKIQASNRVKDLIALDSRSHKSSKNADIYAQNSAKIKEIVPMGSSLKGCVIARGAADIYYRKGETSKWDTCAMQIICEEAGAILRQLDDSEMLYKLNCEHYINKKGFYIANCKENIFKVDF